MSSNQNSEPHITGWVGWIWFAAWLVGLAGAFQIIAGLTAITRGADYYGDKSQIPVQIGYTGWGWIHIFVGIFMIVAAFSLAKGHMYGRIVAVLAATASAITNIAFLGGQSSFWSFIIILMDLLVIWAVMVHGRELKRESSY